VSFLSITRPRVTLNVVNDTPTVETISAGAFQGCTSLVEVDIGRNVQEISEGAFAGCAALEILQLPDWNTFGGPGRIESHAIDGCPNVRVFVGDEDITDTLRAGVSLNFN